MTVSRVQVIGLCTSVMLSGYWHHPPPNLFILPNGSSLPMKQRPPTLSSPQHHHLTSILFTKDCKKPICFCESGLLQYDILRCIQVVSGFSFLLWLHSMGRPLFAYLSMGIWVVPIVSPPRDCHILSGGHTPTVRFHHIVQVSGLSHSAHSFSGLSTCFQYFMSLWDNATNV